MTDQEAVLREVAKERKHQDLKWGTVGENPHEIGQWLAIMQRELDEAKAFYNSCYSRNCLGEILQVVAVGIACMEQHGAVPRDDDCEVRF